MPVLLDASFVEYDDAVGDVHRLLLVVGDQDRGDVHLVVQPPQPCAQVGANLGVEGSEGFVEQQDARLDGQRARERHALALAAAELAGVARLVAAQPDDAEQLVDLGADLGLRALADAQSEGDVLAHGHVLEGRVVLEDEADPAPLGGHGGGVLAGDDDAPRVGLLEAGDDAQQRRLPGAAGPEQRRERAVLHLERDVVERAELAELLRHAVHRDHVWSFRGLSSVMASNVTMAMTPSRAEAA